MIGFEPIVITTANVGQGVCLIRIFIESGLWYLSTIIALHRQCAAIPGIIDPGAGYIKSVAKLMHNHQTKTIWHVVFGRESHSLIYHLAGTVKNTFCF